MDNTQLRHGQYKLHVSFSTFMHSLLSGGTRVRLTNCKKIIQNQLMVAESCPANKQTWLIILRPINFETKKTFGAICFGHLIFNLSKSVNKFILAFTTQTESSSLMIELPAFGDEHHILLSRSIDFRFPYLVQ